jgi:UTP--glucose-1-phosphate uridylyltransferase
MKKIKKAVIPAAGLGTRFLPITKTLAKEMLPIIDCPNLQYIVEECVKCGIEEVILIVSKEKPEIKDYFSRYIKLENHLKKTGKTEEAELIKNVGEMIKISFVTQEKPLGLGNAILCARDAINGEDFALILGDDLVYNPKNPAIGQLIEKYEATGNSIIGVQEVAHDQVSKYGVIDTGKKKGSNCFVINGFVEKPKIEEAPSDYAILGRYVLKNSIFNELATIKKDKKGEYQLTDALSQLLKKEEIDGLVFKGDRYDIGDKLGYIKAIIDYSLKRSELREPVLKYLEEVIKREEK